MTSTMEEVQKVACKLQVTSDQINKLETTFQAFSDACNYINREVDPKLTNNVRIQSLVYRDIREKFGLSANLAVRAINRIATDRKVAKKQGKSTPVYHPTRVDYDARIFTFKESDWTVSLTLVGGRERFKLAIGNYQRSLLKDKIPASATLTKRQDGNYYLKIKV